MADAAEAIRKIEEIVDFWYQSGKLPEDALLNIRRVAREADVDPITEHAEQYASGAMLVRNQRGEVERVYPLEQWIEDQQRNGGRVYRRRVIVVDDWTEVPRG